MTEIKSKFLERFIKVRTVLFRDILGNSNKKRSSSCLCLQEMFVNILNLKYQNLNLLKLENSENPVKPNIIFTPTTFLVMVSVMLPTVLRVGLLTSLCLAMNLPPSDPRVFNMLSRVEYIESAEGGVTTYGKLRELVQTDQIVLAGSAS